MTNYEIQLVLLGFSLCACLFLMFGDY